MCAHPSSTHASLVIVLYLVIVTELALAVFSLHWPFYLLLLAGNMFAFATCALGLRPVEHVYDGGIQVKARARLDAAGAWGLPPVPARALGAPGQVAPQSQRE